jgi:hypothetical protein
MCVIIYNGIKGAGKEIMEYRVTENQHLYTAPSLVFRIAVLNPKMLVNTGG